MSAHLSALSPGDRQRVLARAHREVIKAPEPTSEQLTLIRHALSSTRRGAAA